MALIRIAKKGHRFRYDSMCVVVEDLRYDSVVLSLYEGQRFVKYRELWHGEAFQLTLGRSIYVNEPSPNKVRLVFNIPPQVTIKIDKGEQR